MSRLQCNTVAFCDACAKERLVISRKTDAGEEKSLSVAESGGFHAGDKIYVKKTPFTWKPPSLKAVPTHCALCYKSLSAEDDDEKKETKEEVSAMDDAYEEIYSKMTKWVEEMVDKRPKGTNPISGLEFKFRPEEEEEQKTFSHTVVVDINAQYHGGDRNDPDNYDVQLSVANGTD